MDLTQLLSANPVQRRVVALVAGVALAVLMIQHSAARQAAARAAR